MMTQGPVVATLVLRDSPIYWPAILVWALLPGFGWLAKYLFVVEHADAIT